MDVIERRHEPRVAHAFMVRYRGAEPYQRAWLVSPLHDFNQLGVRFIADRPCEIGESLELQLLLPVTLQPVVTTGKVMWTRPARLGLTEVGVAFDPVQEDAQRVLAAAVEHFRRREDREEESG